MNDAEKQRRKQRRQRELVIRKALRNRDATREQLLAQGRELARRRAENVEASRRDDGAESTNPSVHSTLPAMDTNEQAAAQHSHSTVPERPARSTINTAPRLYGRRLYQRIAPGDPADGERGGEQPDSEQADEGNVNERSDRPDARQEGGDR